MWTTPEKIQKLVLDRQNKKISLGAAEGLMLKAQNVILLATQDRANTPPFTFGPKINNKDQREPLYTTVKDWQPGRGKKSRKTEIWTVNENWIGREVEQSEDDYKVYLFFHTAMCLVKPTGPADAAVCGAFERGHSMRPEATYDCKVLGKIISRYRSKLRPVDGVRPRVTIPTVEAVLDESPLLAVGPDQAGANAITTDIAHSMKTFFYHQDGEEMALAFDDTCWVFSTQWTKWVFIF